MKFEDVREISEAAYQFLSDFKPAEYVDGRHELGDGVFVNISTYETKRRKEAFYEAHKRYIDIQYMIHGKEIIAAEPLDIMHGAKCLMPYDEEKDAEFYADTNDGTDYVITDGEYGIFKPEDGHMPGICVGGTSTVRKAVIKVPVK